MTPPLRWNVALADLDPVRGSEQQGSRPVLIVSNDEFNQAMPNVTVLPLTSTQRDLYPAEVLLAKGEAGLRRDSIVMAHQIRTIAKERIRETWGQLRERGLREAIQAAIRDHLDLD